MPLALDNKELQLALDTGKFRETRHAQYGETLPMAAARDIVQSDYVLTDAEIADLLMDGNALWSFIDTLVKTTKLTELNRMAKNNADISLLPRSTRLNILHNLAALPEGPFFYAVRAMYKDSVSLEDNIWANDNRRAHTRGRGFASGVSGVVYHAVEQESPQLRTAADRLSALGRIAFVANGMGTESEASMLAGHALVDHVTETLRAGGLPVEQPRLDIV